MPTWPPAHANKRLQKFAGELETNSLDFDANVGLGMIYREDGKLEEACRLAENRTGRQT